MRAVALVGLLCLVLCSVGFGAACWAKSEGNSSPKERTWKIGGVERKAILYVPAAASTAKSPVIFAFHGHGGTMQFAARKFGFQTLWPEAIVVYMQGLPTPGMLTDPQGLKAGWQMTEGLEGDRDLKFFDAVLDASKRAQG